LCTDEETKQALNALMTVAQDHLRPIVIWVGAGASAWLGYPFWSDLASEMHSNFSREISTYNRVTSSQLLAEANFPRLFEEMSIVNRGRYLSILSKRFGPRQSTGVYDRFLGILLKLPRVSIVTTNVDETLERNLPDFVTVQHSDIERLPQLLHTRTQFICKLHGSVSAVETMIFSKSDYEGIQNRQYLNDVGCSRVAESACEGNPRRSGGTHCTPSEYPSCGSICV
jgi:hypothetical protein